MLAPLVPQLKGSLAAGDAWARHNGCDSRAKREPVKGKASRDIWSGCRGGATVEVYTLVGSGHLWPGSQRADGYKALLGTPSTDINGNDLAWKFLERAAKQKQ